MQMLMGAIRLVFFNSSAKELLQWEKEQGRRQPALVFLFIVRNPQQSMVFKRSRHTLYM